MNFNLVFLLLVGFGWCFVGSCCGDIYFYGSFTVNLALVVDVVKLL